MQLAMMRYLLVAMTSGACTSAFRLRRDSSAKTQVTIADVKRALQTPGNMTALKGLLDPEEAALLNGLLVGGAVQGGKVGDAPIYQAVELVKQMAATGKAAHAAAQTYIDGVHANFSHCAAQDTTDVDGYTAQYQEALEKNGPCRQAEYDVKTQSDECTGKKASLKQQMDGSKSLFDSKNGAPETNQCEQHTQSRGDWLSAQKIWFDIEFQVWNESKTNHAVAKQAYDDLDCSQPKTAYITKHHECENVLEEISSSSCAGAKAQRTLCDNGGSCYTQHMEAYSAAIVEAKTGVAARKIQWRGATRIVCILYGVGNNSLGALQQCLVDVLDDSHLNLTYPEAPAQATCAASTHYPCTPEFTAAVYDTDPSWNLNITPCSACDMTTGTAATTSGPNYVVTTTTTTLGKYSLRVSKPGHDGRKETCGEWDQHMVATLSECNSAAQEWSPEGAAAEDDPLNPTGCYMYKRDQRTRFNTYQGRSASSPFEAVCRNPAHGVQCAQRPKFNGDWSKISYNNEWDLPSFVNCREAGRNAALTSLLSDHSDGSEDRRWKYVCSDVSQSTLVDCAWTEWTKYDQPFKIGTADGSQGAVVAMQSEHTDQWEDRKYKVEMCQLFGKKPQDQNVWSQPSWSDMDQNVIADPPADYFLTMIESEHDNTAEDRRFKFQYHKFC